NSAVGGGGQAGAMLGYIGAGKGSGGGGASFGSGSGAGHGRALRMAKPTPPVPPPPPATAERASSRRKTVGMSAAESAYPMSLGSAAAAAPPPSGPSLNTASDADERQRLDA